MSRTSKRDADSAFEADSNQQPIKRKRARRVKHHDSLTRPDSTKKAITAPAHSTPASRPATVDRLSHKSSHYDDKNSVTSHTRKSRSKGHNPKSTKRNNQESHLKTDYPVDRIKKNAVSKWHISQSRGGIFLNHDPILTPDGQYLILLTNCEICVYSASTSLQVRAISLDNECTVITCTLSRSDSTHIYIVTSRGLLLKYDWTNGNKINQWNVRSGIASVVALTGDAEQLLTVCLKHGKHELLKITLHPAGQVTVENLLQNHQMQRVQSSVNGSTIAVFGGQRIHIGSRDEENYNWRSITVPGMLSSFDLYVNDSTVNITAGSESGAIFVYQDVLRKLVKNAGRVHESPSDRKLHWHRSQVRSVKWSKDGNYIISGGDETVLVIWQLETNQQQFLPHLSTSILNITVSGAQYALQLGDNSVMVLSTADLTPHTNVAGLSVPAPDSPMQLHPGNTNQLIAAVPIQDNHASTYLQTYDIDTNLQLSKQALTRNLTTTVKIAPNGQTLREPTITHLRISSDSLWLVTVEKWVPHKLDTQAIYLNSEDPPAETMLRIWGWDMSEHSWQLVTRINQPHSVILDLASSPDAAEFATMGEDSIKIWTSQARNRDGVQVRDRNGKPLSNWACAHTIKVENSQKVAGVLTYSEDGSILAASWSQPNRHVHLISRLTCNIEVSYPGLLDKGYASLAIFGRNLICLSGKLRIFDMVSLSMVFEMSMDAHLNSMLAVSSLSNVIAIALNRDGKRKSSAVSIFDVDNPQQGPVFEIETTGHARACLPSGKGFVLVDSGCNIRRISPGDDSRPLAVLDARETTKGIVDIFGGQQKSATKQHRSIDDAVDPQSLTNLSVVTTAAQPGVKALFDQVSRYIIGS